MIEPQNATMRDSRLLYLLRRLGDDGGERRHVLEMLETFALQLTAAILALSISAMNMAFGDVVVICPVTQSVSLTSTGTAPVTINGTTLTEADFIMSRPALPIALHSSQTASLGLSFNPASTGSPAGPMNISSVVSANPEALIRPRRYAARLPTTYYVDNCIKVGNDSNNGTSPSTPWLTIANISTQTLLPGDSILFERTCTWRETLKILTSGSSGSPITFGSYGTGAKPIISGSDIVSTFVADSMTGTWDAAVAIQPNEVWIDEQSLGLPVTAKRKLMSHNQWFWRSGVLSIYSTANPSSHQIVEVADRNYSVYVSAVNYIEFTGLEVEHANIADVLLRDSSYDIVHAMRIHDTPGQGVYVGLGGGGHTIENCEIYSTGSGPNFGAGSAIQLNGEESPPVRLPSLIQNNYIHNIGSSSIGGNHAIYDEVAGDVDRYNDFKDILGGTAIKIDGAGVMVYGNVFDTIPAGGVWIDAYSNVRIFNNTFYNVGTISPYAAISFTGNGSQLAVTVKNNIDYNPRISYSIFLTLNTSAVGVSSDYNDVFGAWYGSLPNGSAYNSLKAWAKASGQDTHSLMVDPAFANPYASRFSLKPGSQVIGAGIYLPGVSTIDPPNMGAL